jgi:hypothetical protein
MSSSLGDSRSCAILCHFDSYSAALLFAHWDTGSLLWPCALPEGTVPCHGPVDASPAPVDALALAQQVTERLGMLPDELVPMPDFEQWMQTPEGPVKVHLLRFATFEAPKLALQSQGGVFKHITQLRGGQPLELGLVREVFNLIVGGSGDAARATR